MFQLFVAQDAAEWTALGGGLCAAFTSACFRKQDHVPPTSGPIQFTLNPQRSKSPVFSRNSCKIKTSLLRRFYDALNYECVPGLCDTALEATQSAVSKQLRNTLRKSAMFCFLVSEVGHYWEEGRFYEINMILAAKNLPFFFLVINKFFTLPCFCLHSSLSRWMSVTLHSNGCTFLTFF